jgi:hypothetical protein
MAANVRQAIRHRRHPPSPLRLDLGGLGRSQQGYLTVNLDPTAWPDYWADVTTLRGAFIRDGSVDEIYLSHTFEHIELSKIDGALACWWRKLKPGGLLRIKGPDVEFYCELLRAGTISEEAFIHLVFSHYPHVVKTPLMGHKWGWTRPFLAQTLLRNGFCDVEEYDAGDWQFDIDWFPEFMHLRIKEVGMLARRPL